MVRCLDIHIWERSTIVTSAYGARLALGTTITYLDEVLRSMSDVVRLFGMAVTAILPMYRIMWR